MMSATLALTILGVLGLLLGYRTVWAWAMVAAHPAYVALFVL